MPQLSDRAELMASAPLCASPAALRFTWLEFFPNFAYRPSQSDLGTLRGSLFTEPTHVPIWKKTDRGPKSYSRKVLGVPNLIFLSHHDLHLRSWTTNHHSSRPLLLFPSGCCTAEESSVAMDVAEIIRKLPIELRLVVIDQAARARKVHFLKLFKTYNGGLYNQPHGFPGMFGDGEPGVEEVSPLSGASKLANLSVAIKDGKFCFPAALGVVVCGRGRPPAFGPIHCPSTGQSLTEARRY